jgi:ketosteroid isomerase-like protein
MKATAIAAALLLCCVGCKPEKEDDLSPQQVAQIKKDASAAVDSIVARFNRLDVDGAMTIYNNAADFLIVGAGGETANSAENRKNNAELVASAERIVVTTKGDDCRVMAADLALCTWTGSEAVTLKAGGSMTYDPFAVTLVMKSIAGQWKVMYSHESGTLKTEPAAKK